MFSCGAIALINSLKWCGLNLSYRCDYNIFVEMCNTDPESGTDRKNITKVLRKFKDVIGFSFKYLVNLKEIETYLSQPGTAIILEYTFKEENGVYDGHYEILFFENGQYWVVNGMRPAPAKQVIEREQIKKRLRCKKDRKFGSPSAWFLYKK